MDSKQIVVLGSCSIDFTTYAERLPAPGETIHGNKFKTSNGGKGANQCFAASLLGGKTAMVAKVGDDNWGKNYIEKFSSLGIDTQYMRIESSETTGIAQINVSKSGENQIVIVAGANNKLSVKDVEDAKDMITNAAVLVCQLETPLESTKKAFELCKGVKILNAAPAKADICHELLSMTTILCVNETEASLMTGNVVDKISDVRSAIEKLLNIGCQTVIITMGANGAVYGTQDQPQLTHVLCDKVIPVDTTGAGDAFIGALATLIASKIDVPFYQVIGAACKVASISVTKEGTQDSYSNIDIEFLIQYDYKYTNNV